MTLPTGELAKHTRRNGEGSGHMLATHCPPSLRPKHTPGVAAWMTSAAMSCLGLKSRRVLSNSIPAAEDSRRNAQRNAKWKGARHERRQPNAWLNRGRPLKSADATYKATVSVDIPLPQHENAREAMLRECPLPDRRLPLPAPRLTNECHRWAAHMIACKLRYAFSGTPGKHEFIAGAAMGSHHESWWRTIAELGRPKARR